MSRPMEATRGHALSPCHDFALALPRPACGASSDPTLNGAGGDADGGPGARPGPSDAAGLPFANDGSPIDASSPVSDGAPPDAASGPLDPKPPAGASPCGAGAFTQADATTECQAGVLGLGSGFVQGRCGSLSLDAGEWKAWCTPTTAYVWMKFAGAALPTPIDGCPAWTIHGMYRNGFASGDLGNSQQSGHTTGDLAATPKDIVMWRTIVLASPSEKGTAALYLGAMPNPQCKNLPSPPRNLFFGGTAKYNQ
jgi:hypothetical protein